MFNQVNLLWQMSCVTTLCGSILRICISMLLWGKRGHKPGQSDCHNTLSQSYTLLNWAKTKEWLRQQCPISSPSFSVPPPGPWHKQLTQLAAPDNNRQEKVPVVKAILCSSHSWVLSPTRVSCGSEVGVSPKTRAMAKVSPSQFPPTCSFLGEGWFPVPADLSKHYSLTWWCKLLPLDCRLFARHVLTAITRQIDNTYQSHSWLVWGSCTVVKQADAWVLFWLHYYVTLSKSLPIFMTWFPSVQYGHNDTELLYDMRWYRTCIRAKDYWYY